MEIRKYITQNILDISRVYISMTLHYTQDASTAQADELITLFGWLRWEVENNQNSLSLFLFKLSNGCNLTTQIMLRYSGRI